MEAHKQEYRVRDLPTKSVTLYPSRAQIVREIKDVVLKPGLNQITVVGLTPTTDEHSIKVEGTGSAIITDITVELLPNRDIFEDIYPESDDDDDDAPEYDDDEEVEKVNKALDDVLDKIQALNDEAKRAKETVSSAESRLKILDAYGNALDKKRGVNIEDSVETYRKEREKVFQDHMAGTVRERELVKEIGVLRTEEARLEKLKYKEQRKAAKEKAKIARARVKEAQKHQRQRAEKLKEKLRIRKELEKFWPKSCYSATITLDAASFTPSSSRRTSIASASDVKFVSEKDPASEDIAAGQTCDLVLTYVTSSAFWSPSYDLSLSTTTNTGMLCFDAMLTNFTSETFSNAKVTLSTSQTTFSGLQDAIPTLVPWRVKLGGRWTGGIQNELIDSREERDQKVSWQAAQVANSVNKPRAELFGLGDQQRGSYPLPKPTTEMYQVQGQLIELQQQKRQMMQAPQAPPPPPGAPFSNVGGGLFGSSSANAISAFGSAAPKMKKASAAARKRDDHGDGSREEDAPSSDVEEEDDGDTMLELTQDQLSFQESAFEETGLTATYDLPNLKTLKPSSTASKQRVARISFNSVYFSHTVVAKYKPIAYLKARLRNSSKLTLLKGPTGLTLDGTFMGRSTLPRCSAGDTFVMSLGVDPAIKVVYPKPDVKRSTTGVFTKGDSSVYTRTITLGNTRATAGKPVNILVLDQVPVSEDEKLRVDILQPKGITTAAGVATGMPGKEGKEQADWGKATASVKKAGEVSWDVVLNAGKSVRLTLEYDVAFPAGERVVQC